MKLLKYSIFVWCMLLLGMGTNGGRQNLPPEFTFRTIDGRIIGFAEIGSGPVVLIVGSPWCPECREEAPEAQKAYLQYKDRGVTFLGVLGGSSEKDIREFVETYSITFPVGKDKGIVDAYGVRVIPQTFFFSRNGVFVKRVTGSVRYQEFVKTLDSILAEK